MLICIGSHYINTPMDNVTITVVFKLQYTVAQHTGAFDNDLAFFINIHHIKKRLLFFNVVAIQVKTR